MNPSLTKIQCLVFVVTSSRVNVAPERIPLVRDNSIIPVKGEEPLNHGARSNWDHRVLASLGHGKQTPIPLKFCIDISHPQFSPGELKGRHGLWIVLHSAFRNYPRIMADRAECRGGEIWFHDSTRETQAWMLQADRDGTTGTIRHSGLDLAAFSSLRGAAAALIKTETFQP